MATTLVCGRIVAPRLRAPAASAWARPLGSSQPSVGRWTAPSTPSVDISGNSAFASSGPMSSSGSPNVLAQPACRRSSSRRSGLDASRSEPTSCHDGSTPVSAASRRYRSAPYIIIRVRVTELRSWPDEAGGMERRAARQLRPIDEHDVAPAELGEVIRDRGAAHPTADDHRPGVLHPFVDLPACAAPLRARANGRLTGLRQPSGGASSMRGAAATPGSRSMPRRRQPAGIASSRSETAALSSSMASPSARSSILSMSLLSRAVRSRAWP